jgi:hypothetical protein
MRRSDPTEGNLFNALACDIDPIFGAAKYNLKLVDLPALY